MKHLILGAFIVLVLASVGWACNIPVFRYALERWQSDGLELLVFHSGKLDEFQQQQLQTLRSQAKSGGGAANLEIRLIDLSASEPAQERAVWEALVVQQAAAESEQQSKSSTSPLPYAVLRGRHIRGPYYGWKGSLEQAAQRLVDSPVRREMGRLLLSGDSIVWLIVKSNDSEANTRVLQLLTEQLKALEESVELPEGIGLPGSELYSEVPLLLKYSILEIDRDDAREDFLLQLCQSFQARAFAEDQPLVIPVFGRGRALEVIPADQISGPLVADLTRFLSAACSCQVKEQNPGFDLLMNVHWQKQLFGEDGQVPPANTADGLGQQRNPVLLQIPPGRR